MLHACSRWTLANLGRSRTVGHRPKKPSTAGSADAAGAGERNLVQYDGGESLSETGDDPRSAITVRPVVPTAAPQATYVQYSKS